MQKNIFISVVGCIIFISNLVGQNGYVRWDSIKVVHDSALAFPWAGGMNTPQFSQVDLNNDGVQDLFAFDQSASRVFTFINAGVAGKVAYRFAPEYEKRFPRMSNWALLRDFNFDGVIDLFTNRPPTYVNVYKGKYLNDTISFDLFIERPSYKPSTPSPQWLQIVSTDIPVIQDINYDGDLDILAFNVEGGIQVRYYENVSNDSNYCDTITCDSMYFKLIDNCFGSFEENGVDNSITLGVSCKTRKTSSKNAVHSGSTMLYMDVDGNGLEDLILGDISFNNLNVLYNFGDSMSATFTQVDSFFPRGTKEAKINNFPALYSVDVNNDGLRDILATPNAELSENYFSCWYYQNEGNTDTPSFQFQTDQFLIHDMIDVGEGAMPVFFDYNGDSLLDLLVGNNNKYDLIQSSASLTLYENTGTKYLPEFTRVTTDYLGLESLGILGLFPAVADIDTDGDIDLFLGTDGGYLIFYENTAGRGNIADFKAPVSNYANIDVGEYSTPFLYDMNEDGALDLLVGERSGNVNYFPNIGTPTNPVFRDTLTNGFFGKIDTRGGSAAIGYSQPFITTIDSTHNKYLLSASRLGGIYVYDFEGKHLDSAFTLLTNQFEDIWLGLRSTIATGDINGDGIPELVIGNYTGGVSLYTSADSVIYVYIPEDTSNTGIVKPEDSIDNSLLGIDQLFRIVPNPVHERLVITRKNINPDHAYFELYNLLGERVQTIDLTVTQEKVELNTRLLSNGVYFLRTEEYIKKIVIQHD